MALAPESGPQEELFDFKKSGSKISWHRPFNGICRILIIYSTVNEISRQSYSQNRTVLYRALYCVNQWEEEKYFSLFRYWLKSKGTLQTSL
jgi:hypothetical protein